MLYWKLIINNHFNNCSIRYVRKHNGANDGTDIVKPGHRTNTIFGSVNMYTLLVFFWILSKIG